MSEYHKIQTVFLRDPETKYKTLLDGVFSKPEFEYLAHNEWSFTEKVDGTNIRVIFDGEKITFAGKTDNAQIPPFLQSALDDAFILKTNLLKEKFPDGVVLYGEGYGAKIQKGGGNYRQDNGLVLFDVNVGGWWLSRPDVIDVASFIDAEVVPEIGTGTLFDMVEICKTGYLSQWGEFRAEGIVARPVVELKTRGGERIITKLKCRDFGGAG